jgi:hypothetical protein
VATVAVLTRNPLIRAGYERAVSITRLELHSGIDGADLALRSEDDHPSEAPIEIVVGHGNAVVTVRTVPDEATWSAALKLLKALLS